MPARPPRPVPPRAAAPDLPRVLDDITTLSARIDVQQARISGLSGDAEAAYAHFSECRFEAASVDRLDLTGASLADVDVEELRATTLLASSGRWRSVRLRGGRVGSLDLSRTELDAVELRGMRIDYLSLAQAQVNDLLVVDCTIGAVDMPLARLTRIRFSDCRADEVDTRDMRAVDLDLRGLDALAYTDPTALRGATLTPRHVAELSASLAAALGIDVRE